MVTFRHMVLLFTATLLGGCEQEVHYTTAAPVTSVSALSLPEVQ